MSFWRERLLVILACAPLLVGLGNDLSEFDPTQYAEAGRHLAEAGGWMHPQDNFGPYDDKPPLVFWLIALSIKLFGATSLAVRLPTVAAVLLAVAATVRIGRELWGEREGLLAGALFASSPAAHLLVADPKIDGVVTACMAWAVALLLAARRRPLLALPAWSCVGLGLLTKGPIALVAPLLAVLPEALRARPRWRLYLWPGLGLVAAICAPYALSRDSRLLYFHLWEQSFGRLTGQSVWRNNTTPLFFVHTALWAFLPFAPALVAALWLKLRAVLRDRALPPDAARVPLWWLLLPFAGISASAYKLPHYLYWLAPPAALLAARLLVELEEHGRPLVRRALVSLQLLISLAAPVLAVLVVTIAFPPELRSMRALWPLLCLGLSVTGLVALRRLPFATGLTASGAAALGAVMLLFHGHLHPAVLSFQPDRALAEAARVADPGGEVLPFVGVTPTNAAGFHGRRKAREFSAAQLAEIVRAGGARAAIVDPAQVPALEAAGLRVEPLLSRPAFTVSRPSVAFLLERSRPGTLRQVELVGLTRR